MGSAQTAGHSVRQASRRSYGAALSSAAGAVALLAIGLSLGAIGAPEVGGLFIVGGLLFVWDARQRRREGKRFKAGAIVEERVGSRLWKLEDLGWLVEHDAQKSGGGNVDHVVQSPAVTFVIETKAGAVRSPDLAQVRRHAEWAARRYGSQRDIVPVLCLLRSKQTPDLVEGIHRVGAPNLVDFMLDRG